MSTEHSVPVPPVSAEEPGPRPLLRRSRSDRMVFGVCGGLGRYLGIDAVAVRIVFVVLTLFGGSGLLLYLIGLVAIPEEREGEDVAAAGVTSASGTLLVGAALVVFGSLLLLRQVIPDVSPLFGPLVLIGLGVAVVLGGRR